MSDNRPITILALASEFKGVPFLEECKRQGCRVLLLQGEKAFGYPWPDSIDEKYEIHDLSRQPDITYAVSYLTRGNRVDRVVALDDYDVATAASLREHLRLPGMGESLVRHFRDKLGMRQRAQDQGILVPPFASFFNYDDLRAFMAAVPPPWVIKPRFEAGAVGIQKMHSDEQVWRKLDALGDQQSYYLLEKFVPGDVYHVDALVWDGEIVFIQTSRYGAPPLSITTGGGIFNTRTLSPESEEGRALREHTAVLLQGLGMTQGVTHTEFIRGHADGQFYFLETAARVGGANIDRLVKAASGIELWAEAARIELASIRGEQYQLPSVREDMAGLIICLAKQQWPDLSSYQDDEIVWRLQDKEYHAGLLLASPEAGRVEHLLHTYSERFAHDFLTSAPPKADVRTQI